MSNIYVYSGATGTGDGSSWANAYTTLKAAAEAAGTAAGDDIWVAHDHAETGASALTITFKGTSPLPTRVLCVNRAGSVPPVAADLATTATVTTTGNSAITLTGVLQGANYIEGIAFSAGTGAVNAGVVLGNTITRLNFRNCVFKKMGTAGGVTVSVGGRNLVYLYNCNITPAVAAGDSITASGRLHWFGGSLTAPGLQTLITGAGTTPSWAEFDGVDLSAVISVLCTYGGQPNWRLFANCKLAAGVSLATLNTSAAEDDVTMVNCDSGATNYRTERAAYQGTQVIETTIVRTGGASDGTTPIAWKIATAANSNVTSPYISIPITVWNDTTGAKTVSIYGYWNNAAVPTNAQIWMEAEYLGTAGFPISSFVSSGPATVLSAGSNIPSDASTWGGSVTTSKFKMSVSLTTAMKGPITVRIRVAAASSTFYIDPKIEVV